MLGLGREAPGLKFESHEIPEAGSRSICSKGLDLLYNKASGFGLSGFGVGIGLLDV